MRVAIVLGFCLGLAMTSAAIAQENDQGRLRKLHDDLRLTAGQEAAWRDYTTALTPDAQAEDRLNAAEQLLPQLTTPRRIALIEATRAQEGADLHRRSEVVNAFYARLSADQQRTFDRETLPDSMGQSAR